MGERGIDHRQVPTEEEVRLMGGLAAEAIEAGALGFSTSRSKNHKASDGRITPSYSAGDAELLGIAQAIGNTRKGVFEMNVENTDVDGELALMRRIGEVSGRPLSAALLQRPGQPTVNYRRVLEGFERAASDGLSLWGQVAPRPTGLLITLRSKLNPMSASPTFQSLARVDEQALSDALQGAEIRDQILSEMTGEPGMIAHYRYAFDLGNPPRYDQDPSASLVDRADARGVPLREIVYEILAAGGIVYVPVSNYVEGDLRAAREMLIHPHTVPGLSDGGAHSTMVADFDYPTFLLSYWTRDAPVDLRLPVEWAVKRQCADTASLVGLDDRGLLAPGKRADLNLIELSSVGSTFPTIVDDLPGGGSRLVSRGTGYIATIVAGQVSFEGGLHNGTTGGSLARGGRL
jgi:N-acyl-D-aspartate/D-glutamate deacylase